MKDFFMMQSALSDAISLVEQKAVTTGGLFDPKDLFISFSEGVKQLYAAVAHPLKRLQILEQVRITTQMDAEKKSRLFSSSHYDYVIQLLDIEIETAREQLRSGMLSTELPQLAPSRSPFQWTGQVNQIFEVVCALFFSGKITRNDGTPVHFLDFVRQFEQLLNFRVKEPYKRKRVLLERKRNPTPYLDHLRNVFREAGEKLND